jgi:Ca-activated chloride channel family protein
VSFAAPLVLLGLIALPLLAVWYAVEQRRRRQQARSFAQQQMAPSVAPHRPGWRRHVPFVAFALAAAVLIAAVARPRTTDAVTIDRASIMLATDISGSMQATDVAPSRLVAARQAAERFAATVPAQVSVGALEFNQQPTILQAPTTDRAALRAALARMRVSGGTAIGNAIDTALAVLNAQPGSRTARPPAAIVLLSDGYSTSGIDPLTAARQARAEHIPIYTVALGTPGGTIAVRTRSGGTVTRGVPPDPQALGQVATASGGRAYTAQDAAGLRAVYTRLGRQFTHRKVVHDITAAFAGGGLLLLALGSAFSLRWFGRLL